MTALLPGSMFFLMTVGTTIGYGNYTPQTVGGQIYVVMYALKPIQSSVRLIMSVNSLTARPTDPLFSCPLFPHSPSVYHLSLFHAA